MSTGDAELDRKLDKLMKKLKDLGAAESKNVLVPITLQGKEAHFYWSITHKMFLEIPIPSELYLMTNRSEKEGKYYVFSPWLFNCGAIFLIPKEKVIKIGEN